MNRDAQRTAIRTQREQLSRELKSPDLKSAQFAQMILNSRTAAMAVPPQGIEETVITTAGNHP